jgi:two-component system, NtrC family, response regulator AtoC
VARILVVDDEDSLREFLVEALEGAGHEVLEADGGAAALERLATANVQLVITDLKMPGVDGMEVVRHVRADHPDVEIVVLTAHATVDSAVEGMKLGVFDYLQKPLSGPAELRLLAERALERHRLRAAAEASRDAAVPTLGFGAPAMKPVVDALRKVAPTRATVLLLGESGTGKEVAAKAVHAMSDRRDGPFVAVNCAALAESLLESELFGHEKGAFTGAVARRRGRIELADGGTFFLDEVGELAPGLQAKLLRVLEERGFERVGGSQTVQVDVRWIAATNRDLQAMTLTGAFREDLYHRLAVFPVRLPPLRERTEDIVPLAELLLGRIARAMGRPSLRITPAAATVLRRAQWRGNVRELANALERAAILVEGDHIDASLLSLAPAVRDAPGIAYVPKSLADLERDAIRDAMQRHGGNRKNVAQELGISVRTLYDKLRRYDLEPE